LAYKHFQYGTEDEGSNTSRGFAGGGQIGCDYQFASNFVIGALGLFDSTSISGTDIDPNNDGDEYTTDVHWFGTITGRLGFLVTPALLFYGKGGVAWINESHSYFASGLPEGTAGLRRTGWDAGAGLEWMSTANWSAWIEYDHMGFGTKRVSFPGFDEDITQSVDKVLVGFNWRFARY
jgi:outer membrane immunogenic protein